MELKISAADYRDLVAALDARFPGFAEAVNTGTVVAIDGEIFSDPFLQPVYADSEVHFLPAIGGG